MLLEVVAGVILIATIMTESFVGDGNEWRLKLA